LRVRLGAKLLDIGGRLLNGLGKIGRRRDDLLPENAEYRPLSAEGTPLVPETLK
jgi:hypothetical protein